MSDSNMKIEDLLDIYYSIINDLSIKVDTIYDMVESEDRDNESLLKMIQIYATSIGSLLMIKLIIIEHLDNMPDEERKLVKNEEDVLFTGCPEFVKNETVYNRIYSKPIMNIDGDNVIITLDLKCIPERYSHFIWFKDSNSDGVVLDILQVEIDDEEKGTARVTCKIIPDVTVPYKSYNMPVWVTI